MAYPYDTYSFNFKKSPEPVLERNVLRASGELDFPSIAAASSAELTIDAVGAEVGDGVFVHFDADGPVDGLLFTGWVSAADTITVRATNVTAAPIDDSAQTYHVVVVKA